MVPKVRWGVPSVERHYDNMFRLRTVRLSRAKPPSPLSLKTSPLRKRNKSNFASANTQYTNLLEAAKHVQAPDAHGAFNLLKYIVICARLIPKPSYCGSFDGLELCRAAVWLTLRNILCMFRKLFIFLIRKWSQCPRI